MANVNLGVGIQDNTRQGLSSAYNNVTKMTAKMAKELVMEVGVKFPDIADQIRGFESDLRKANNAIGKFQFLGERFGKQGQSLGLIDFDASSLKGNLSADKLNAIIPKLKDIRNGLATGSIKSSDFLGLGLDKELDFLDKIIERLVTVKDKYELIMRTNSKRNTELTSQAAKLNQLKQEKTIKEQIESVDRSLNRLAASDKSEREKLKEELELLKIKERYLKQQDKLNGIPDAEPSDELVRTRKRIEEIKAMQKLSNIYNTHNNLLTKLRNIAGQYFSLQGIKSFIQKVAEVTGYYERQQVALEGILRSASDAQSAMNQLKQLALNSPFQVKDLVRDTKQLAAFGVEAENLIPTVSKLADISTGLGVDMSRIILAYGQVKSATVLRGQELRQFTEAGIPMVDALAKKFTALNGELITTADVFELISKRQVSFEMVSSVMSDMASEGGQFYKMQERITDTLAGQIEKLKDIYDQELNDIGGDVDGLLMRIVKFAQTAVKNTKSISAAMMIMIPTSYVIREIARMQMEFAKLDAEQQAKAGKWWKHAAKSGGLLAGIGGLAATAGIGIAVGLIVKAIDNATRLRKELEKVGEAFNKETSQMISGLDSLTKKITAAKIGTKEYNDAIETLATNYGDFVSVDVINALKSQGDEAANTANQFKNTAENIKEAIKYYNEYKELEAKEETAKEQFIEKATKNQFNLESDAVTISDRSYLYNKVSSMIGREADITDINKIWDEKYKEAVREFAKSDNLSEENFRSIYKEILIDAFPDLSEWSLGFAGTQAWSKIDSINDKYINSIQDNRNRAKQTDYYKINKAFESVDTSKVTGTPKEQYIANEKAYRGVLTQTGKGSLHDIMSEIVNSQDEEHIENAKKAFENLYKTLNNGDKTARDVVEAFNELYNTIGDSDSRNKIVRIGEWYEKNAGPMTKDQDQLSERMNSSIKFKNETINVDGEDKSIQEYFDSWNPAVRRNETLQQTQEKIANEYSSLKRELEMYASEDSDLFNDEIEYIKKRMEVLKEIAGKYYYNVDLSDKAKNKYERLRVTDFYTSVLSIIKKAEDATEKIVGVTGYTDQLAAFVNELGDDNFLKEFFKEGGNPFKALMEELKAEGVTEFLPEVNEDLLKTIFRQAGWEEGKELSVPDFQAMYKRAVELLGTELLERLKEKAKALPDGAEKNSVNNEIKRLQEKQVSAIKELKTRWGDQEIESKLLEMIKGLTDINSNLTKIREKNDLFERVAKASNYSTAQEAIYGKDSKYKLFVGSGYTSDAILQMLQSEGGQGLAGTNAGVQLKALLEGGNLNISNLTQLVDIMHDLEEQAAVMSVTAETNEAKRNAEQFKKVTGQFSEQIKKLCDDIINELEALKAARTEGMVGRDKIDTANTNYKNSITAIENALNNGTIKDKDEADKMKLQATQNLYNELLEALGGEGMPQWAMNLFGDKGSLSGISDLGKTLNSMFGGRSLQDLVSQGIADKYQAGGFGEAGSEEAMLAAGEAASSAASAMAMVDMIIKAIYDVLSFATKLGTQIIDWMEKTNDVTKSVVKKADGSTRTIRSAKDFDYTNDMYATYTEKYDSDKLARQKASLQAVQTFNQHIMDGWEQLKSGNVLGAVYETIASIGDLVVDIFGISDSTREATIQNYLHDIERMDKALGTLDFRTTFMSGLEALDEQSKKLDILREQQEAFEAAWDEENAKKSSDKAKLDEYQDGATEKFREQLELIKSMKEEIMGTADALADSLSGALVNSFKEGKNAAREWKDTLKSYIGEVMQQMLINKIFGTQLDKLMDQWMYGFTDTYDSNGNLVTAEQKAAEKYGEQTDEVMAERLADPKLAEQFYKSGIDLGNYLIDYIEGLPEDTKDFMFYKGSTSALSGGISGITEDTARQLEGIGNSMLMQQIIGNQHLEDINRHLFATVQVSWFNEMLQNSRSIKNATENLNSAISEMRDYGSRALRVTMS